MRIKEWFKNGDFNSFIWLSILSLPIHEPLAITMSQVKHSYPITYVYKVVLLILELQWVHIMLIMFKGGPGMVLIKIHLRKQLAQGIQAQMVAKQNHLKDIMLEQIIQLNEITLEQIQILFTSPIINLITIL